MTTKSSIVIQSKARMHQHELRNIIPVEIERVMTVSPGSEFILVFDSITDVQCCIEDKRNLQERYGITLEEARISLEYMDDHQVENESGVDNPALPSLMHLNDYCLLHLLSYLPEELLLGDVCKRMARLCKEREKINHYKGSGLKVIFHHGPMLTHLSVEVSRIDNIDLFDLIKLRCVNMKFFSLAFDRIAEANENCLVTLCGIIPSLRELVLDEVGYLTCEQYEDGGYEPVINACLDAAKGSCIQKLRVSFMGYVIDQFEGFDPTFMQMTSLTTLIVPQFDVDIGRILIELPNLRALACRLLDCDKYPTNHGLQDFFGFHHNRDWKLSLQRLSEACPGLRNFRLCSCDYVPDYQCIPTFFPALEGLFLEDFDTPDIFELAGAEKLKTFIFETSFDRRGDFSMVFTEFYKLEVLYWNQSTHGDIMEYLKLRSSDRPLTIVTNCQPTEAERKKRPEVKWMQFLRDVFGPFSIFGVQKTF